MPVFAAMLPESFHLRDATETDLDAILALDVASFKYPWSRASFGQALADRDRTLVIVLEHTEAREEAEGSVLPPSSLICGFGVAWSVADEGEIATLAVSPAERRRGLGEKIVCALRRTADSARSDTDISGSTPLEPARAAVI